MILFDKIYLNSPKRSYAEVSKRNKSRRAEADAEAVLDPKIRLVEPYGLLLGARRYLVGKVKNGSGKIQHFRMDRIVHAQLEASSFSRDPNFDLAQHEVKAH